MTPQTPRRRSGAPGGEETALARALREIARRPLTVAELRGVLLRARHSPEEVDRVASHLRQAGQLDDLALACHFILTRSERLGHGRARLLADLERRGVERTVAEAAWTRSLREESVDPGRALARQIERRVGGAGRKLGERDYARVYNALLRAGFEPGAVEAALESYRAGDAPDLAERTDDDIA